MEALKFEVQDQNLQTGINPAASLVQVRSLPLRYTHVFQIEVIVTNPYCDDGQKVVQFMIIKIIRISHSF